MKKLFKNKQGFTLIELLVVIGILAVLAAIAIPSVAGLIDRANVSSDETNANEMTNAIERFASEYELYVQDIGSGALNPNDLDSAQGRVYNVTGATTRGDITAIEKAQSVKVADVGDEVAIYRDTKYPVNNATLHKIVENYMKTSSSTFEPKQSDCNYYYSPDCGIVVCTETDKSTVTELNTLVVSGKDAKGNQLTSKTQWINLTTEMQVTTQLSKLIPMNWNGLTDFNGQYIWTDGTNIYYSLGTEQYVLNGNTWEPKVWSGLTDFYGSYIWTDGSTMYYSNPNGTNKQYVLEGNTWKSKSWSGLTNAEGRNVWTDGKNIYHSTSHGRHYILDGNTWKTKTWSGEKRFNGSDVWTDGTNIYYTSTYGKYVLDGNTWKSKTWDAPNGAWFTGGSYIWTDGTDIYSAYNNNHYVLNGDTWETMTWNGFTNFNASNIWTDGINIYYSSGTNQYIFS